MNGGNGTRQDVCRFCDVPGKVTQVGTASGRKHWRCPECGNIWREKNAAAMALGSLGGKARAEALTPERRREIARKARAAATESAGQFNHARIGKDGAK